MTTKAELSGATGTFLTCPEHPWVRYSATPGDYFWADDDYVFECKCGEPMFEARESCSIVAVTS